MRSKEKARRTGASALFISAEKGFANVVNKLLRLGAHVNTSDTQGHCALYAAAWEGRTEIVKMITDRRQINLNILSNSGLTPMCVAAYRGHADVTRLLAERGADVNHAGPNGVTPLWVVSRENDLRIAKILVEEFDADIHTPYSSHMVTPIWIAAQEGHVEMVSYLVKRGADVNITSLRGATPLHISLLAGQQQVFRKLLMIGAEAKIDNWANFKKNLTGFPGFSTWVYDALVDQEACYHALCLFAGSKKSKEGWIFRSGQVGCKVRQELVSYLVYPNEGCRRTLRSIAKALEIELGGHKKARRSRTGRVAAIRDLTRVARCFSTGCKDHDQPV